MVIDSWEKRGLGGIIKVAVVVLAVLFEVNGLDPKVRTKFGVIQGKWSTSTRGRPVAHYLGIPYALPPIGELRFKSPQPWNRTWAEPYKAVTDAPMCVQSYNDKVIMGKENCLYLNIFVPVVSGNRDKKLPVLAFVSGLIFIVGNTDSERYAPDYLMDQNIILVTINYRLSVLGFFSTGNKVAPGNYGLKDIAMALQWIQENIESFQGDPNSVTLNGHSGGAVATHLLALSSRSEGLFHKYIVQSGSALATWGIHSRENIRDVSLEIARRVGCLPSENSTEATAVVDEVEKGENNTRNEEFIAEEYNEADNYENYTMQDDEEIMRCMGLVDEQEIMHAYHRLKVWRYNPLCIFGPTIEDESEDAVVTMHPMTAIKTHQFRDIPWIIGVVKDEGLLKSLGFVANLEMANEMLNNFETYLPYLLEYHEIVSNATTFARAIEDFYFHGNVTGELLPNITDVLSDALFNWPAYQALQYQSEIMNSSSYFYIFSYEGTYAINVYSGLFWHEGVAHEDDLNYLFPLYTNLLKDDRYHNTLNDVTMINIITEMWASFATEGVPKAWRIPRWPDYSENQEFLRFGIGKSPDVVVERNFLPEKMAFWEEFSANLTSELEVHLIPKNPLLFDDESNAGVFNYENRLLITLFVLITKCLL